MVGWFRGWGLGQIEGITRRHFSYYGGNKNSRRFYTPPSKHRPETSEDVSGQGNHIIPISFLSYAIVAMLVNSNIKTLHVQFEEISRLIFPEQDTPIEHKEYNRMREEFLKKKVALEEKFQIRRNARKTFTASKRAISGDEATQRNAP